MGNIRVTSVCILEICRNRKTTALRYKEGHQAYEYSEDG
jgi:hypothetical protein